MTLHCTPPKPPSARIFLRSPRSFRRAARAFLALCAPLFAAPMAHADPVAESLAYRAYIGGLPLGTLQLQIAMDDSRYATQAQFDMTALLRVVLDTDARASSSGALRNGDAVPQSFDYWLRDGKKTRETKMEFDSGGNPVEVIATPKFDEKTYDMNIDMAKGAIDPTTAIAMLSAPRGTACDVDMRVYDGRKLHSVKLRAASVPSKDPERTKCEGRYERLAGFKAKYMTPERRAYNFEAELIEIGPNRWRPKRVWAQTKFGAAVAVLQ